MFSWLARLFGPKPADGAETAAPALVVPAAVAVAQNPDTALPGQGGGRKTRHRRRRSPRHHRK
jgi:hypothetical protein